MSDDEQEQEVDNRTIRGNSKNGRQTASFPSPALATSTKPSEVSEVPEDAEHVTMAPNTSRCRCEQTTSRIPKTSREPIGCQRSPENVLLSLIVVAPGFIAVYTAIIIGASKNHSRTDDYSARVSQRRSLSIRYSSGATRCSVGDH